MADDGRQLREVAADAPEHELLEVHLEHARARLAQRLPMALDASRRADLVWRRPQQCEEGEPRVAVRAAIEQQGTDAVAMQDRGELGDEPVGAFDRDAAGEESVRENRQAQAALAGQRLHRRLDGLQRRVDRGVRRRVERHGSRRRAERAGELQDAWHLGRRLLDGC